MLSPRIDRLALTWAPLLAITIQIIPTDTLPWKVGRRSMPASISYRLDAWSQYDNPEEGTAREGDIHEDTLSRKTSTTRQHLLWKDGVVHYHLDSSIVNEPAKHGVLDQALATIEENTCVKFVRIFPENGDSPRSGWVNVTGNQRGCFSDLGRSAGAGPSVLNLDVQSCFRTRGHALHELLHTLGVYHEHMRPDRDEYITILWDNIRKADVYNFRVLDKKIVTNYNLPYDYDSIMHYSMTAFAKDKSAPTIVPVERDVGIGQRNRLSSRDIQKLLITYKCANFDKVLARRKIDNTDSGRLEILNFNSSNIISEARNAHSSGENYDQPLKKPGIGQRSLNRPLPDCSCPCNPFFHYYSKISRFGLSL